MIPDSNGRVLLTGSTGTVGSAILQLLASDRRFEVHTIVRRPQAGRTGWIEHVFDLSSDDFVRPLSGLEFDFIIDCAQPRHNEGSRGDHFGVPFIRKLESLCTNRTKRLIYTGGVWVYGNRPKGFSIDETSSLNPLSYARTRMPILEYLSRSSDHRWIQLCLPSLVYGSGGPLDGMKTALAHGTSRVIDDLTIEWSVIERTDLARAYLAVLESDGSERLFVIAEPLAVPIVSFYRRVAEILKVPFHPKPRDELAKELPKEAFEVIAASQPVDSRLIRERTGWSNSVTFEADVGRFISSEGG